MKTKINLLDSIIIILSAATLTLFLLWAAGEVLQLGIFDNPPKYLKTVANNLFLFLTGGAGLSLVAIIIRNQVGNREERPNYVIYILSVTAVLVIMVFLVSEVLSQANRIKINKEKIDDSISSQTQRPDSVPGSITENFTLSFIRSKIDTVISLEDGTILDAHSELDFALNNRTNNSIVLDRITIKVIELMDFDTIYNPPHGGMTAINAYYDVVISPRDDSLTYDLTHTIPPKSVERIILVLKLDGTYKADPNYSYSKMACRAKMVFNYDYDKKLESPPFEIILFASTEIIINDNSNEQVIIDPEDQL